MTANYPAPIFLCRGISTTGLQPAVIDIGAAITARLPVVLQIMISVTGTVQVLGSVEISPTGTLVDPVDYSVGGFTTSDGWDLISGIQFWQINILANAGLITAKAGVGATGPGQTGLVQLVRFTNAATNGL